jgi:hypothetical protein
VSDEQTDLLRQLIDNIDQFRESMIETVKVLHRKQKQIDDRLAYIETVVRVMSAGLFVIVLILVIATIASLVRG